MQTADILPWMQQDILLKADKMCMAHSLELRVPFLDKKVLEFAETVPVDYRIQGTDTKICLLYTSSQKAAAPIPEADGKRRGVLLQSPAFPKIPGFSG